MPCDRQIGPYPCCTVVQGDCLELMKQLPDGCVDAVITDPPYGIGFRSNGQWFRASTPLSGDDDTSVAEAVASWAYGIPTAMFFSPYRPILVQWRSVLVWAKGEHVGIGGDRETCWKRDFELIGVRHNRPLNGNRDSAVLRVSAMLPPPSGHFAEKPTELMAYLVEKLSQPTQTIIDPFCGSGTTLVAAKKLGRHFLGFEISPEYCEIARKRIALVEAQPSLFEKKPEQQAIFTETNP